MFRDTGSPSATRATLTYDTTIPDRAHRNAVRDSFELGSAAWDVCWHYT